MRQKCYLTSATDRVWLISYKLRLSHMGGDVGQIFPTASLHRDHSISFALVSEKEEFVPRIADWHHKACRVMPNGDSEGRIFLSHPHMKNGFFSNSPLNTSRDFRKILNSVRCDMVTSF